MYIPVLVTVVDRTTWCYRKSQTQLPLTATNKSPVLLLSWSSLIALSLRHLYSKFSAECNSERIFTRKPS